MTWPFQDPQFESDLINQKLQFSPWSGHRNFAYDLLAFIKPQSVVELGSYFGCSFFAFCQAVKDLQLSTNLTAIDTWQGTDEYDIYEQKSLQVFQETIQKHFPALNIDLKQMLFDEALNHFPENSIDLIHLDGDHRYEATATDFKNWLPKLKENGLVLFHDTSHLNPNDHPSNNGSATFWDEIKTEYPSQEFPHSWGLGLLFPKGDALFNKLQPFHAHNKDHYRYKHQSRVYKIQLKKAEKLAVDRYETIKSQKKLIDTRDESIKSQAQLITDKDKSIATQKELIDARNTALKSQTHLIDSRDEALKSQTKLIDDRDKYIAERQAASDKLKNKRVIKFLKKINYLENE